MMDRQPRGRLKLLLAAAIACAVARTAVGQDEPPEPITTTTGAKIVLLPEGWFEMGSEDGSGDEKPAHRVWVDAVYMDVYEVTQQQYELMMTDNPSHFKGGKHPVEKVDRAAAIAFCNARSRAEGLEPCYDEDTFACDFEAGGYRLPTEAEWEHACRAGSEEAYSFGDDPAALDDHAWHAENSDETTHPIGLATPNRWGLHDMHGNVAEWCNDLYDPRYYESSPERNPKGPEDGGEFVIRGGAWNSPAEECRSAYRLGDDPGFQDPCFRGEHIGFRCVRRVP